jgi:Fic family protein
MPYLPQYTISPQLLAKAEEIAALRERIRMASVTPSWIPVLQKDTRARIVHASTAIEGNPLSLEQVRALEAGRDPGLPQPLEKREVFNYFSGLRFVEKRAANSRISHEDIFELHHLLAADVMDQGEAGRYRSISVRVGHHVPPPPHEIPGLMFDLLEWWNKESAKLSPVLSSPILHSRFEAIHPFDDGNGHTGRAMALWDLYRRGFDAHRIFPVDEFYRQDRPGYYRHLDGVREAGGDLTGWLEYCAEGLHQTLEKAWLRVQAFNRNTPGKVVLRPRQEELLNLLRDQGSLAPNEIWSALNVSRQGAMDLLRPLMEAGLVEKVGGKKMGRYILKNP